MKFNVQTLLQTAALTVALVPLSESATCTVGPQPLTETSPSTLSGLYINRDHPAPCDGFLTLWHLCYYAPRRNRARDYLVQLQIWRQDTTDASMYLQEGQTTQTITVPRQQPSNEFQCVDIELTEDEYISVLTGDLLGVYIPTSANILPVVSNSAAGTQTQLHYFEPSITVPSEVSLSQQSLRQGNVLHLTADINNIVELQSSIQMPPKISTSQFPSTASSQFIQTTSQSPQPSTTVFSLPGSMTGEVSITTTMFMVSLSPTPEPIATSVVEKSSGLSSGAVAGIVLTVLILVIVVSAAVTIGLFIFIYQYRKQKSGRINKAGSNFSLDNAMYEVPVPIRANTALLNQLNVYNEIQPISSQSEQTSRPRPPQESVYVAMEGSESIQVNYRVEPVFNDSFDSGATHSVEDHRYITHEDSAQACGILNIYETFGPGHPEYDQFMKQATLSNGNQLTRSGNVNPYCDPPNEEEEIYKALSSKTNTIPNKDVKIIELIGSGEFAEVSKATWKNQYGTLEVAVKKLRINASEMDKIKLLQEAAIMGQFIHPNVVRLHGVVSDKKNIMIVCEYLERGDLVNTLRRMRPLPGKEVEDNTPKVLLNYCQQVVLGMHYLSSKGFVHRDLAARNILVSRTNICKICDFGMSRDLLDADYYVSQGGVVPVRWTAPEAIFFRKYSTDSDIWSYGCVLWEIWSLGSRPYQDVANKTVVEMIANGYRLPPPPGCPEVIYNLMIQCWNSFPNYRPSFREILVKLLEEEDTVLAVPKQDALTHNQASMLGASLTAGEKMYKVLQDTYVTDKPSPIAARDGSNSGIEVDWKASAQRPVPVVPKRHNNLKPLIAKKTTNLKTEVEVEEVHEENHDDPNNNDEIYDDTVTVKYSSTENLLFSDQNSHHSTQSNGTHHICQDQYNQSNVYDDIQFADYDVLENSHAISNNVGTSSEPYYQLPLEGQNSLQDSTENLYEAI